MIRIVCNMCFEECFEYSKITADWGYGTKKDGSRWRMHFCEECSDSIADFIKMKGGRITGEQEEEDSI